MENNYVEQLPFDPNAKRASLWESLRLPIIFTALIWLVHIFQILADVDLGALGIYPREAFGLRGILFAPLLHSGWGHLASNSVPFLVCATMIIYFYPRVALRTFVVIYLFSGFCVWLFARTGVFHIGLSYVVYGLVSFIFWTGIFRRSMKSVVLALIIVTLYSGMFSGVLPTTEVLQRNISWESHLIGAIIGVIAAYFYKEEVEFDEIEAIYYAQNESQKVFLPYNIFEKTKAQRIFEEQERIRLEYEERWRREYEERLRREYEERLKQQFPPYNSGWTTDSTY